MIDTNLHSYSIYPNFILKDPGSSITHFIAFMAAILSTPVLLVHSSYMGANLYQMISLSIFCMGMILLYGASTAFHSFNISEKGNSILKKLDHMMIFVLIASSYTPICTIVLKGLSGKIMLVSIWTLAISGMILKYFFVYCPKWFSSVIYIAMGWLCVFKMSSIYSSLPKNGFLCLLAGGIIYTIGGILYALKLDAFNNRFKNFGSHEIFHLFVMLGNFFHYILMYKYLTF